MKSPSKRKQQSPPHELQGGEVKSLGGVAGGKLKEKPDIESVTDSSGTCTSPCKRRRTKSSDSNRSEIQRQRQKKKRQSLSDSSSPTRGDVPAVLNGAKSPTRQARRHSNLESPLLLGGALHGVSTPPKTSNRKLNYQSPILHHGKMLFYNRRLYSSFRETMLEGLYPLGQLSLKMPHNTFPFHIPSPRTANTFSTPGVLCEA